ncbi:hypothetical protein H257_10740 [Aphanomyces astaci]|uniref:DDE Tnp4 domain-containing protein n=1 Tax=Aphanomyces astaci TaxID=112090 RepID=W4G6R0_APHAT|nr:hypothetical protein H257_10740 [Aphanomyces astaci]ETV74603.1 hypothetical protein H257_10740 [Aphanomyces astaci]|eukprot:XP_009835690.1 hypothetical protein H257_10740 [Aphanomyces astaci]
MKTKDVIVIAVASTISAVCVGIAAFTRSAKYNVLTVSSIDFDAMLGDRQYEQWFLLNLRCNQATFVGIVAWFRSVQAPTTPRKSVHSMEKKAGGVFGMSKSRCICVVHRMVELGFFKKQQIPGIVGAVDGTLIDIQHPADYDGFYNRNGDPSLNTQGTFPNIEDCHEREVTRPHRVHRPLRAIAAIETTTFNRSILLT